MQDEIFSRKKVLVNGLAYMISDEVCEEKKGVQQIRRRNTVIFETVMSRDMENIISGAERAKVIVLPRSVKRIG